MKKRKVAIIAGSRGEYGYIRPVIREIEKHPDLDYGIIATNMHVLERFGSSIDEMKKDEFKVDGTIFNTLDGYNHLTMTKSLSIFMLQLPELLEQMGADMLLVSGDRGEQLMAAIVGAYTYRPVAHIQAGEVSGNIDGVARHAITKFSHLHFAANEDARSRVLKMGEQEFRVHNVGAPQLDEIISGRITPREEVIKKFSIDENKPIFIVVQHPVTEDMGRGEEHMGATLKAVAKFDANIIVVMNNSDAGAGLLGQAIAKFRTPNMHLVTSMPREDYMGLMNIADVLVGNSSSGILEAPSFKLPAINIGRRQQDRMQGINVINCSHDEGEIINAINVALSPAFTEQMKDCVNPYGDGKSAERIVKILGDLVIDEELLIKRITY